MRPIEIRTYPEDADANLNNLQIIQISDTGSILLAECIRPGVYRMGERLWPERNNYDALQLGLILGRNWYDSFDTFNDEPVIRLKSGISGR